MRHGKDMKKNEKNILKLLFDFQKFENNPKLSKVIKENESLSSTKLEEKDLTFVNAAGDFSMQAGTITGNPSDKE